MPLKPLGLPMAYLVLTAVWIMHKQLSSSSSVTCWALTTSYAVQVQEKLDKFQQRRLHEFFVPGVGSSKADKVADLEVRSLSAAAWEHMCQAAACMSAHSFGASCHCQQAKT